jgi:hypothetical protein
MSEKVGSDHKATDYLKPGKNADGSFQPLN